MSVTPGQRENDPELSVGESLDFSWEQGDLDAERFCSGGVWSMLFGYGDVDSE